MEKVESNPSLLILSLNTRENQFPISVVGMGGKMQEIYFKSFDSIKFQAGDPSCQSKQCGNLSSYDSTRGPRY